MDLQSEADRYLMQFASYEAYLDSMITETDMQNVGSIERARFLTELGARNIAEVLTAEEFRARRAAVAKTLSRKPYLLYSENIQLSEPLLVALAEREEANRTRMMFTIIFMRDVSHSREVSAYIDYAERLQREDWRPIFEGKRRIVWKNSDLSTHNWRTGVTKFNDSINFTNHVHPEHGLAFRCRLDSEHLLVDPTAPSPGNNTVLIQVQTTSYELILLYDHLVRRR